MARKVPRSVVRSARRVLPPPDRHLSGLDLLDESRLAEVLGAASGRPPGPASPRVDYLEYSPGRALVLQASVEEHGRCRSAVVRAGTAVHAGTRPGGAWLPQPGLLVHWFPVDPLLPALALPAAGLQALLTVGRNVPTGVVARAPELLAYVPGRRATLSVPPYVVKAYATHGRFRAARQAMLLLGAGTGLPAPRPVASVVSHRLTVQRFVAGRPASRDDALALAPAVRAVLDRLHASPHVAPARRDAFLQLRRARSAVEVVAAVLPESAPRAHRLLSRLAHDVPTGLPMVLSHGDFSIDQLLVTEDGRLVVTDVDNACRAPAALDVAGFAANLMSGRCGDADLADAVLEALVAFGGRPPALGWHYAAALLRRCDRPFRRLKKGWPDKTVAILDHVERVYGPVG